MSKRHPNKQARKRIDRVLRERFAEPFNGTLQGVTLEDKLREWKRDREALVVEGFVVEGSVK